MGTFLDKIMIISLEKSKENNDKREKEIKLEVDSCYKKALTLIEKAANKGTFHTSFTINNREHSKDIANALSHRLMEEGFVSTARHGYLTSDVDVSWPPFEYRTKRVVANGRFQRVKKFINSCL